MKGMYHTPNYPVYWKIFFWNCVAHFDLFRGTQFGKVCFKMVFF